MTAPTPAALDALAAESPYPWSKVQHIPGTSVVNGGTLLLDASGAAMGLVVVIDCEHGDAVRPAITRALNTAGNVGKTLRMLDCSRREGAEALAQVETLTAERTAARAANERDRTAVADALGAIKSAIGSRAWMSTGRGSYAWDDDRYQRDFAAALDEINAAADKLRPIAADWSDSPMSPADIIDARTDWKARVLAADTARAAAEAALACYRARSAAPVPDAAVEAAVLDYQNFEMLIRDLRPFAKKQIGSIRIDMEDVRSILAFYDARSANRPACEPVSEPGSAS